MNDVSALHHRLAVAPSRKARTAIVGGVQIPIDRAPWQVALIGEVPTEYEGEPALLTELCGGAIISETRVLTAAHCMFNPLTGAQAPAADFYIVAGSSDFKETEAAEQRAMVASARVHPYFSYATGPGGGDDVAILTLAKPLDLAGAAVRPISIAPAFSALPQGAGVGLTGFGLQASGVSPNGKLYSLEMTLASNACGGEARAVILCASSSSGSGCNGDSGGGLTQAGVLFGIVSAVDGGECSEQSINIFTGLTAPEIRDFIENENALPPMAPRGGGDLKLEYDGYPVLRPIAEHPMTCNAGKWSNSPTFTYAFIDSASGEVLQSSESPVFTPSAADAGRRVLCQVKVENAGGSVTEQTEATQAVESNWIGESGAQAAAQVLAEAARKQHEAEEKNKLPPPIPMPPPQPLVPEPGEVSLASKRIAVQRDGEASVTLYCAGGESCNGRLTLAAAKTVGRRAHAKRTTVMLASATFSIPVDGTKTVKLVLSRMGRALLLADHGSLSASLTVGELQSGSMHTQVTSVRVLQREVARRRAR